MKWDILLYRHHDGYTQTLPARLESLGGGLENLRIPGHLSATSFPTCPFSHVSTSARNWALLSRGILQEVMGPSEGPKPSSQAIQTPGGEIAAEALDPPLEEFPEEPLDHRSLPSSCQKEMVLSHNPLRLEEVSRFPETRPRSRRKSAHRKFAQKERPRFLTGPLREHLA